MQTIDMIKEDMGAVGRFLWGEAVAASRIAGVVAGYAAAAFLTLFGFWILLIAVMV